MIDWREGTETQTLRQEVTWEAVGDQVLITVGWWATDNHGLRHKGIESETYLDREQARNMMCGLAHVLGEINA